MTLKKLRQSLRCMILFPIVATVVLGCGDKQESEPVVRPVRYEAVYSTGAARERIFSGVSQAGMESQLSFKVGGTIRRLAVSVGDAVSAGDVIAELDPEDYRLRVQETRASLARAQAEARNASSNYDRVRALYENRNASRQDLDAARTAVESSEAQQEALRNSLELAELQLGYARLTAPMSGAISKVPIEVNENVQPGTPVAVLTAGGRPEVSVAIPEQLISQIREGQPATVTFDAVSGRSFSAKVTEVGVASGGIATTFPVAVTLDNEDSALRQGMAAQVAISFAGGGGSAERFLVPVHAVGEDREGRFVFLGDPKSAGLGVVRRQPVIVGEITNDGLEVLGGLKDGDLLITAGVTRIHDGLTVRLTDAGREDQ